MHRQNLGLYSTMALLITFVMSSCATLMNSPRKRLHIQTSEPASVVVGKDTLLTVGNKTNKVVKRKNEPLVITAFTEQKRKTITLQPKNSGAYLLNAVPSIHLWTGFLIDKNKQKRYTYNANLYIDFQKADSSYNRAPRSGKIKKPEDNQPSGIKNLVKFSPLRIMNPINPAIAVSYERVTGTFYSSTLGAGWILPLAIMQSPSPANRGFTISFEERRYFKPAPLKKFVGLELFYLQNRYKDVEVFAPEEFASWNGPDEEKYQDSINISKRSIALNARAGIQAVGKKMSFEVSVGLGIKYRHVVHYDRINPDHKPVGTRHPNVYHMSNMEGNLVRPNLVVDIRLGYRL